MHEGCCTLVFAARPRPRAGAPLWARAPAGLCALSCPDRGHPEGQDPIRAITPGSPLPFVPFPPKPLAPRALDGAVISPLPAPALLPPHPARGAADNALPAPAGPRSRRGGAAPGVSQRRQSGGPPAFCRSCRPRAPPLRRGACAGSRARFVQPSPSRSSHRLSGFGTPAAPGTARGAGCHPLLPLRARPLRCRSSVRKPLARVLRRWRRRQRGARPLGLLREGWGLPSPRCHPPWRWRCRHPAPAPASLPAGADRSTLLRRARGKPRRLAPACSDRSAARPPRAGGCRAGEAG